jgi:hypothetical protein
MREAAFTGSSQLSSWALFQIYSSSLSCCPSHPHIWRLKRWSIGMVIAFMNGKLRGKEFSVQHL